MEDYDIDSKHDVVLRTLKTVVINKVLFWRIFSYDPEQGKPDFDKLCDVSLEEIPKLAKAIPYTLNFLPLVVTVKGD
eukprot:jgi/Bigna1/127817/aug1.5_g2525